MTHEEDAEIGGMPGRVEAGLTVSEVQLAQPHRRTAVFTADGASIDASEATHSLTFFVHTPVASPASRPQMKQHRRGQTHQLRNPTDRVH